MCAQAIRLEGIVLAELKRDVLFSVELRNGHRLFGHVPLKLKDTICPLKSGDRVEIEATPFDLSKGRIIGKRDSYESASVS